MAQPIRSILVTPGGSQFTQIYNEENKENDNEKEQKVEITPLNTLRVRTVDNLERTRLHQRTGNWRLNRQRMQNMIDNAPAYVEIVNQEGTYMVRARIICIQRVPHDVERLRNRSIVWFEYVDNISNCNIGPRLPGPGPISYHST